MSFSLRSKHWMCSLVPDAISNYLDDALLFNYAADHPMAVEFEEQSSGLVGGRLRVMSSGLMSRNKRGICFQ
jgi:hypothetical protein